MAERALPDQPAAAVARCEACGNADQSRFVRYYVEEARERLVGGRWVVEEAWEYDDGARTRTVCEECGRGPVVEESAPST